MQNKKLLISLIVSVIAAVIVVWKYNKEKRVVESNQLSPLAVLHHSIQTKTDIVKTAPQSSTQETISPESSSGSTELPICNNGLHRSQKFVDLSARNKKLQQSLQNSNEIEHQFLATLLNREISQQAKINSLSSLFEESPNNEIIAYNLLALCAEGQQLCTQELLDKLMAVQKDNGTAWALISGISAQKDQKQQAVQALINASKAPYFENYLELNTKFIDNAYRDMGADDDLLLYAALMTHSISSSLPVIPIINLCQPPLLSDSEVLDACFHAGNIFRQGTPMTKIGGAAIQMYVYTELDDESSLQAVKKELTELQKYATRHGKAMNILARHKSAIVDWLELKLAGDDSGSQAFVIEQSQKITATLNSNACNLNW